MRVRYAEGAEARRLAELDVRAEAAFRAFGARPDGAGFLAELGVAARALELERGVDAKGQLLWLLRGTLPSGNLLAERVVARRCGDCAVAAQQPRLPFDVAVRSVLRESGVDFSRARARAGFARGHLLDVSVFVPGGGTSEEASAATLVRRLLGDRLSSAWIGQVRTAPLPRGVLRVLDNATDERQFPLSELASAVDAAVAGLHDGLPAEPWWATTREAESVVFELEPEPEPDYAAQDDVVIASSCAPEMLHCFLRGAPFSSERFSRHGERFAYVKFRSCSADLEIAMGERDELEQELDELLVARRAGRVVGRGLGLVYSYLDLALVALDDTLACLRELAERRDLPAESWLLFCDSELEDEWLGLRADSPPPP